MNKDVSLRDAIFGVVAGLGLLLAPLCVAHAEEDADAQPAAAPGTQVVDANGTIVGTLIGQDLIERKIHGIWVNIAGNLGNSDTAEGFYNSFNGSGITFYFTTTNCTGTNYLYAADLPAVSYFGSADITATGYATAGTLYFPGAPRKTLTINSSVILSSSGFSSCNTETPFTLFVGPTEKVDLNFVAPFTLQ